MDDVRLGFLKHAIEVGIVIRNSTPDGELLCHEQFPITDCNDTRVV